MNRTRLRSAAGLCFIAALHVTAAAQTNSPFVSTTRGSTQRANEREVVRTRNVTIKTAALDFKLRTITLPLFDGITVTATRERTTSTKWGDVWSGKTREPGGLVMIAKRGRDYAIHVRPGGSKLRNRLYEVVPIGEGVHQVREIDTNRYPPDGKGTEVHPPKDRGKGDADDCATDPPDEIDVMIVYTDDARVAAGTTTAIELQALLAIEASNIAYANSDVTQRLNLVQLMEVDYAEQDNETTDLNNLQGTADGNIDNIHAIRDSVGADVVSMLVSKLNGWAGWANIMGTVDASFASSAFSLVKWSSAVGNLSFPHELGHNMGARHDWPNDGTNNSPYVFNHGAFNTAPTAPANPWRTIMSYSNVSNGCDAAGGCTRLQFFSNPSINEPVGGDPFGSSVDPQTDNHLTLNNTALTVANFRCRAPSATDVWMKDTWNDTGAEPDPATAAENMWQSPYIWVRNAQDATLTKQHMHEDPNASANVFAYVKLHNGGTTTENGTLELYYANAEVSLDWNSAWTLIASTPVSSFAAHTTRVVEVPWSTPSSGGHYCLVARYVSATDPMTVAETPDINANVRANNNLAWRNLNILGGGDMDATFWMANHTKKRMSSSLVFSPPRGARNFLTEGRVLVMLDDELLRLWKSGGGKSRNVERQGRFFVVTGPSASFDNFILPVGFRGRVFVRFEPSKKTNTTYVVDATHKIQSGVLGGVSYEIHTEKGFQEGTTVQQ